MSYHLRDECIGSCIKQRQECLRLLPNVHRHEVLEADHQVSDRRQSRVGPRPGLDVNTLCQRLESWEIIIIPLFNYN